MLKLNHHHNTHSHISSFHKEKAMGSIAQIGGFVKGFLPLAKTL